MQKSSKFKKPNNTKFQKQALGLAPRRSVLKGSGGKSSNGQQSLQSFAKQRLEQAITSGRDSSFDDALRPTAHQPTVLSILTSN